MNMKLVVIALSGAMLISGTALGMEFDPKFYVGGELQAHKSKINKKINANPNVTVQRLDNKPLFDEKTGGADLFVGSRLTENVGVELGAGVINGTKLNIVTPSVLAGSSLKLKNKNAYADVMGYLPVCQDVDLIGAVGVGRLNSKIEGKVVNNGVTLSKDSIKSTKTGLRLGLGAQYKFNENLGARVMVRNQKGNAIVKSTTSAGLG